MRVAQLRKLLAKMADLHQKGGRMADADALRKLAAALKAADKQTVAQALQQLKS